jgi:hypothetical protein
LVAIDVVAQLLLQHPEIRSIRCIEYVPRPTFRDVSRRRSSAFLLKRRLRHSPTYRRVLTLVRLTAIDRLRREMRTLPAGHAIALSSRVRLNGRLRREAHFVLVDFECRRSRRNLTRVGAGMWHIDPGGGLVLASKHSYHYYGRSLLSPIAWRAMVGRCLLMAPLVDVRYLGHCLVEGETALRISPYTSSPEAPYVVATVGGKNRIHKHPAAWARRSSRERQ